MTAYELRARLSFPGQTRALSETASVMEAWARVAARILAPELTWIATLEESEEIEGEGRWGTAFVVRLEGSDAHGAARGRGEVRLTAGGDRKRLGGNGLVEIETVRPTRYLLADNHCNVAHWDLSVVPVTDAQLEGLRHALEELIGHRAEIGGERRHELVRGAQLVASGSSDDAVVWMEDLESVGLSCRGHANGERFTILVERGALRDVEELREARIALGEVLSEAGDEDWHERSRSFLARLPDDEGSEHSR
jgi:hypothetical protein